MAGESGLGSKAFRRRRSDRSVSEPEWPPRELAGEVASKCGTPATMSGRKTPRLNTVDTVDMARTAKVTRGVT